MSSVSFNFFLLSHFVFISYRSFVSEDAGPNTLIATVHAIDPDGDSVSYSITGGNWNGNFIIDSQKGRGVISVP